MSDLIVKKLEEEIKGNNRKEEIEAIEEQLSKETEQLSKNQIFFNLPLKNIFSVISKFDFNLIEENDKIIEIIQNIIKNIINSHFEEKETILILQYLNITTIPFSYEEIISILETITNCPILVTFCKSYKGQKQLPHKDYKYELQQKEEEIEKLKQNMQVFQEILVPVIKKPKDFQPNLFIACKEGKLTSVKWLIEKEKVYKEDLDKSLLYASEEGQLPIVEYLILKGANIEAKGDGGKTPLHFACWVGRLKVVEYLISKGAYIEAKDMNNWTPLHLASFNGQIDVVKYLVSKGAKKNVKNDWHQTPYDLAKKDEIKDILK